MLTFSKDAGDSLGARTRLLLPKGAPAPQTGTFHSFALKLLRAEGFAANVWTVEEGKYAVELKKAAGAAQKQLGDYSEPDPKVIRTFVGFAKGLAVLPESEADIRELTKIAKGFATTHGDGVDHELLLLSMLAAEEARVKMKILTFDDMLAYAARLLSTNERLRKRWAAKYDELIQDEAQDQNKAQAIIAAALTQEHRNYMAVGDPSQTIYGFRGAEAKRLMRMAEEATVYTLPLNYRSDAPIVEAANAMLAHVEDRLVEQMIPASPATPSGACTTYKHFSSSMDEATWIGNVIQMNRKAGKEYHDMAVLVRVNRAASFFEAAFSQMNIPYVLATDMGFWQTKIPATVCAYLAIINGTFGADEIKISVQRPNRYITNAAAYEIGQRALKSTAATWGEFVHKLALANVVPGYVADRLATWVNALSKGYAFISDNRSPITIYHMLEQELGLLAWARKEEGRSGFGDAEDPKAILSTIAEHIGRYETLDDFLGYVTRMNKRANKRGGEKGHVLISTIHRAKGLEWPAVFVAGFSEGMIPMSRRASVLQEEARLAYVAISRAMKHLVITSTGTPSLWLHDLPFARTEAASVPVEKQAPRLTFAAPDQWTEDGLDVDIDNDAFIGALEGRSRGA
jgi:DNA helicase-2/ATP-dependent DNA helicase PcrA